MLNFKSIYCLHSIYLSVQQFVFISLVLDLSHDGDLHFINNLLCRMDPLTVFFHCCHAVLNVLAKLFEINIHIHFNWSHEFCEHFFKHGSLLHIELLSTVHLIEIYKFIFNTGKFSLLAYHIIFESSNITFQFFCLFLDFLKKNISFFRFRT